MKGKDQVMQLLVSLTQHSPEVSQSIVQHVMGLSRKATPTATPHAVELLHRLCVPDTEESLQRYCTPLLYLLLPSLSLSLSLSLSGVLCV